MRFLQSNPILGVRYNVVRRPLSGGKGTIVQGKGTQGSKCPKCKGSCTVVNVAFGENRRMQCPKCGGKGRVGGKPAETKEAYYDRLAKYIRDEPATYFFRWKVAVGPRDVERFRRECLDPILEQLCWWWDSVTCKIDPKHNRLSDLIASLNFRMPYGVWNPLLEGNATEYDEFLRTGNAMGLQKVTDLFPELKEGKP